LVKIIPSIHIPREGLLMEELDSTKEEKDIGVIIVDFLKPSTCSCRERLTRFWDKFQDHYITGTGSIVYKVYV